MSDESTFRVSVPFALGRVVRVDFSGSDAGYQRVPFDDTAEEAQIDEIWRRRCESNPSLFDASKFRLSHVTLTSDVALLHLGLTDYRTYLATHHGDKALARKHRALALGNVIVLVTVDQCVPFLMRSKQSATHPMRLALPGGHPEPDDLQRGAKSKSQSQSENREIEQLLAIATRNEGLEELFLDDLQICPAEQFTFLGIVDRMPDEKPSTIYLARTPLSADDVKKKYAIGNVDKEESVEIVVTPVSHLLELASAAQAEDESVVKKYVPETLGAAVLYSQMAEASKSK